MMHDASGHVDLDVGAALGTVWRVLDAIDTVGA